MHKDHAALHPLRHAWGLEVDAGDPNGVGPEAAAQAALPQELSRALDGVRKRIPLPELPAEPLRSAMLAPALASAEQELPFPLLSQYARFWRDGVRTAYEDEVRRLGIMTGEAVLAALATGQTRWIDRAADGLLLLCELSTWCWVAHEEVHDRRGWVVPDIEAPVVDLGAAQTLHVLAWADLALGESLDDRVPGLRRRMRQEADRRVFSPYLARRDWHWLHGTAHNWTGWIHQHLIAGALFLLDGESERTTRDAILALSIAQLDRYLASFPADGGIDEGFSYFWNGASRLLEGIDLLLLAADGRLDRTEIASIDVIAQLLRFPQRMDLGRGWFVNVSDGPARPPAEQPWDVLHRWGRTLGATDVVAQSLVHRRPSSVPPVTPTLGLGRVLVALADRSWREAVENEVCAPLPSRVWLPDVQVMVAREREGDPSGLAVAAKGGHNDEAHNHLDVGSYLVALDSAPVLIDLGQPTYTSLTFTSRRYEIWTMTSSWHNLPRIRGHEQGVGAQHAAEVLSVALGDDSDATASSLTLELAGAYPDAAGVHSYRRRVSLERSPTSGAEVRIADAWQLSPVDVAAEGPDTLIHHVIAGEIVEHGPGRLLVTSLSGGLAEITWDEHLGAGTLERRQVDDPLLADSWGEWVHRLSLVVSSHQVTVTLREVRDAAL